MTRYSPISASAVRSAATFVAVRTGTATTLDVKRRLRDLGYWAVQRDVSAHLAALAHAHRWPWWPMGRFRLYALPRGREPGVQVAASRAQAN